MKPMVFEIIGLSCHRGSIPGIVGLLLPSCVYILSSMTVTRIPDPMRRTGWAAI
jgi:hypothetical protein